MKCKLGRKSFLTFFLIANHSMIAHGECTLARKFVNLPGEYAGTFTRVHPSGKYLIVSKFGGVKLLDITGDTAIPISTPMQDETNFVQGSGRLIASPNHEMRMKYFLTDEIIDKGPDAKMLFDDDHNQFYHSAAELKPSTISSFNFRTLLYSKEYCDYSVQVKGNKATEVKSECGSICENGWVKEVDGTDSTLARQRKADRKILAELNREFKKLIKEKKNLPLVTPNEQDGTRGKIQILHANLNYQISLVLQKIEPLHASLSPGRFEQPILSQDGTEVGALIDGKTKLFKILPNGQCKMEHDFKYDTSKVGFSAPEVGKKGKVAFLAEGRVMIYDRDRDLPVDVTGPNEGFEDDFSYPGFTKDGRLIYQTKMSDGQYKIVILDPSRLNDRPGTCLQQESPVSNGGSKR